MTSDQASCELDTTTSGAPLILAAFSDGETRGYMEGPQERLEAEVCGRSAAEAFDRELRERELAEREARLTRMAWGAEDEPLAPWTNGREPYDEVWRLQKDVERLTLFHHAVVHSKGWRALQVLRRPFGRDW